MIWKRRHSPAGAWRRLIRAAVLALVTGLAGIHPAAAQEKPEGKADATLQDLIYQLSDQVGTDGKTTPRMTQALDFLTKQVEEAIARINELRAENESLRVQSHELSGEMARKAGEQDEVIQELESQVRQLADILSLEKREAQTLKQSLEAVSSELAATILDRDKAGSELAETKRALSTDRETIRARTRELENVTRELKRLRAEHDAMARDLSEARRSLSSEKETIESQTRQLTDIQRDLRALSRQRADLEAREARLRDLLKQRDKSIAAESAISREAQRKVDLLNRQIAEVRRQLAALNEVLDASEAKNKEQNVTIVDLNRRLNRALATKVQELARYRSEFFGRLREVLGERRDVRIVGDRFVFQSEVLFNSGRAELEEAGKEQLLQFAKTLNEVIPTIPSDLEWVLRVDGHTDVRPIATARFPSNWELSTARATSVVKFLIEHGIPGRNLVAAGFGAHHPLDDRDDEIAFRRNRRIEFKLTQK